MCLSSTFSFIECIPVSFAQHISKDNFLTKIRIRRVFSEFVRTFQQHTVDSGHLGAQEIMYKYISTLEHLAPSFGTETFSVTDWRLTEHSNGDSSYTRCDDDLKKPCCAAATHEIMVSGTKGVQWRRLCQKVCQKTVLIPSFGVLSSFLLTFCLLSFFSRNRWTLI